MIRRLVPRLARLLTLLPALLALLPALLAASCEKETPTRIELRQTEVLLESAEGAQTTCRIAASGSWTLTIAGGDFEATPQRGGAGETELTITSTSANTQRQRRTLGTIELRPDATGESRRIEVRQRPSIAPRSFFFFFIGTSLQRFFDKNLRAALSAVDETMPGDGRMAAFRYNGTDQVWEIVELHYDPALEAGTITTVERLEEIDRSDPAFITEVIGKMESYFPAEEYALAFGGHGSGWIPTGSILANLSRLRAEAAAEGYPITRYYGEPGSQFEVEEIARSLAATGIRFDCLCFDDCFMSNIETLYALRENALYIIASPCEVMGEGFPYQYVIPAVFHATAPLPDRLQAICEGYYRYYLNEYDTYYRSGCIALTQCEQLEALADASRQLFATASETCDPTRLQHYEGLSSHLFYDFRQYMEQVATDERALEEFQEQFDRTFPPACRLHTPSFYSVYSPRNLIPIEYYSGVTCSAPARRYATANRQTEWWRATHP
ncbi:MAG: clostripain-related cysteine peptidase [Alistipes sp.]|nr:clostripain-related cysteine peptidase [Alistipes senegalensis]MCM1250137.1 clostripain-related cysteine peptidase [Alistipes sp.]